jgi:hypothetical protein
MHEPTEKRSTPYPPGGEDDTDERATVPELAGAARIRNARAGRTAEFRGGERFRGDLGGSARGDGLPDVPHSYDDAPVPTRPRRR